MNSPATSHQPSATSHQPIATVPVRPELDPISGVAAGFQYFVQGYAESARNTHYRFSDTPDHPPADPHGD